MHDKPPSTVFNKQKSSFQKLVGLLLISKVKEMRFKMAKSTFTIRDIHKAKNDAMPVRYVCKDCLRTLKDEIYNPTYVCWKCGGKLVAIEIYKGVVSEENNSLNQKQ